MRLRQRPIRTPIICRRRCCGVLRIPRVRRIPHVRRARGANLERGEEPEAGRSLLTVPGAGEICRYTLLTYSPYDGQLASGGDGNSFSNTMGDLIQSVYPELQNRIRPPAYLASRPILSPQYADADGANENLTQRVTLPWPSCSLSHC